MKIQLIAALFIAALVAVPSFAEEESPVNEDVPTVNGGLQSEDAQEPPSNGEGLTADTEEEPTRRAEDESEDDDEDEPEEEDENVDDNSVPEEMQDEVENVKRARRRLVQLSHRSCLILKRYGYCRHSGIAKFCRRQCRRCKNLISYSSCSLIKRKYRRCNHNVGRVYCRNTCGHCGKPKFRTLTPYWCGASNRRLWRSRVTLRQCQAWCVKRGRGCKAIEWWGKYNFNCYICLNPKKMKKYTNRRDLAWPPYVSIKYR